MKRYLYFLGMLLWYCSSIFGQTGGGFDPSNPPEPNMQYTLSLQTSPTGAGSFSGAGKYAAGTTVRVYAYNNTGFKFKWWMEDGNMISTSSSFNYTMPAKNTTLTAVFEYDPGNPAEPLPFPQKYTLNLVAQPGNAGSFNRESGGRYEEGSSVYLYAYTNTGFKFREWRDGEQILSTNRNFDYTMPGENKTLTAVYYYDPDTPSEPNEPTGTEHALIALTQSGEAGQQVAFPVYLLNQKIDIHSVEFDIAFPENLIVDYQNTTLSGRINGHQLFLTSTGNNQFHFLVDSEAGNPFFDSNGILLTIPLTFPNEWNPGETYPVTISNVLLGSTQGVIASTAKNGALKVSGTTEHSIYAGFYPTKFLNRVLFTNLSSETATGFLWDFGDGGTGTEREPLHTYAASGNYEVKLKASNAYTSDSATINVDINPENLWNVSGVFSLNKHKKEVKNFTSLDELFRLFSRTTLIGNVTVQTEAGEIFEIPLSGINSEYVTTLKNKIRNSNRTFTFIKDGNAANPVISITGNAGDNLDNMKDLFSVITLNEVDLMLFGIPIRLSQLDQYREQNICSGNTTEIVDFSLISNGLNYSWTLADAPQNLTGYQTGGTGNIPAMTLTNTSSQKVELKYHVSIKLNATTLFEQEYSIGVLPVLSGTIRNLFPNNNEEVLSTQVEFSWDAIENAVYDLYLWETGTAVPDVPFAAGLTAFRYTGASSYCRYGKNYTWKVIARNECTHIESQAVQFRIRELPDLHVTAINFSDAFAGKTLTVSWKVKNDGSGSTGTVQWTDQIWLVPDIYTGTTNECRLLKSVDNLSALAPGQEYENSTEVTLPERLSGNFYIAVLSDMYDIQSIDWTPAGNTVPNPYTPGSDGIPYPYLNAATSSHYNKVEEIGETANTSDNFFYKQIDIQIPPLPDIQVVSVVSQNNTYSGQDVRVDVVIANKGEADILYTGSWAVAVYVSKKQEFDATAVHLSYRYGVMPLTVNESKTINFSVKTPLDYSGETYFFAVADCFDNIYEHAKENNNTGRSDAVNIILTPPADLAPSNLVIPSLISTGATFEIKADITNKGAGKPNNTYWTDCIYLSENGTQLDNSAVQIASYSRNETLNPGRSYPIRQDVRLPDIAEGDYFVYVHTDVNNNVFELDNQNNIYRSQNTVRVVKPDLTVRWGSMPEKLTSGKLENLSWIVRNNAQGEIKDKDISDYFYLSKSVNGTNAVYLTEHTYNIQLAKGQEKQNYLSATVPYNQSLEGKCYLFVRTDNWNAVSEISEANNTATCEFTYQYIPLPDLTVSDVSAGGQAVPGELLSVSYRLNNIGALSITGENYPVNIYISKKQNLDNEAVKCEIVQQIQPGSGSGKQIAPNAYTDFVQQIRIPANIQGGSSYLHIVANENNVLEEINTENNRIATGIFVAGNLPALKVSSYTIPENVLSSVPVEYEWTIANNGQVAATGFTDAVYISSDNVLNGSDERLYLSENNVLPAGNTSHRKVSVSIPDKWHGERYILIATNDNNKLQEADYTDNIIAVPVTVTLSPLPDLAVTTFTAEPNARSGQSFQIKYQVSNTGVHKTRQDKWSDEFYLSPGTTLDKNHDYFLGKKLRIGALEAGATYTDSVEVTIPADASGNYNVTVYTDAGDVIYETDQINNIKQQSVAVYRPLPCDLVVENVSAPAVITVGEQLEIGWTIRNNSNYPMEGVLSDAIYFSKDRTWDISDYYVSNVESDIELLPGQTIEQKMFGLINRVPEGEYYVIIKTNQQNNIIESSYDNNATAAEISSTVVFETLGVNSSRQVNAKIKYYKLDVDESLEGQTLALNLTGNGLKKDIGLYVAHNAVPTVAVYDFSSTDPMHTEQEVIIPSLGKGTYYVMVQDKQEIIKAVAQYPRIRLLLAPGGTGSVMGRVVMIGYAAFWGYGSFIPSPDYITQVYFNETPLNLSTKVLQFEISSVSDNKGANAGSVTSSVSGAKFDSIMDFRLKTPDGFIPAEAVYVENQSAAWVTFNLKATPAGNYDVEAELPVNLTTLKENGYSVIPGVASQLYTKIVIPSSIRINTKIPFSIEFANAGNTDVKASELLLVSENGHPIGLNTQELDSAYTEIRVPIGGTGNNRATHV
ncbi:MAG: PKD domain-containing protein, partial [Dysgonamonadaceae bacterium]|nr:PKD domain-containing protein [Dysgonamonadaceae bacterium]